MTIANDFCRHANRNGVFWNFTMDDGTGSNYGTIVNYRPF